MLPLRVDVAQTRRPWANQALIAVTVAVFFSTTTAGVLDPDARHGLVLDGVGIGMLGHVLLHADGMHLFGNMVFLWVFGNAVCSRVGSWGYLLCYAGLATTAAVVHLMCSDRPAIGASGAVNGVVGMFVAFHPKDHVQFGIVGLNRLDDAPAWVLVLLWLVLDLCGWLAGADDVAHAAHLGGLAAGFALAVFLLVRELVPDGPGPTVLDLRWRR